MDNPTVAGLRSRSRSKTPFLRSSCDRENCGEGEDHTHHKSGRKTPIKRNTPVKQLRRNSSARASVEIIPEELEHVSPPAHRTRQSTRTATEKLIKTSDYSSEESPDRWRNSKEIAQNQQNYRYEYERVSTSSAQRAAGSLADLTLSPIHGYSNITADRSTRFGSPASVSACSTDSSFAEQALADASTLVERDPEHSPDHLPYRLYKMAGEYWNKYPKTDYTYSPLSKDRVELAPGQVAVPNMSRRSLSQFRLQGPNTSPDEVDLKMVMRTTSTLRKRYTNLDSSDDETSYRNGGYTVPSRRWSITTLLISIITTITTSVTNTASAIRNKVFGAPSRRYSSYSDRREEGLASRAASMAAAPFYWTYMIIKKVITTTVTTITETISPSATSNHVSSSYMRTERKSRRWPWFLLLLLPILGYGSYYSYENLDRIAFPNFTDFQLDLTEFSPIALAQRTLPSLPNITLPDISIPLPEINITLPDIKASLPQVSETYHVYKVKIHNGMTDASDYFKLVAEGCFEEMRRFWQGVIG